MVVAIIKNGEGKFYEHKAVTQLKIAIAHQYNEQTNTLIAMNNKLLLVKGITLLYRESQLPGTQENSAGLVRELLGVIKMPEVSVGIDHQRDILLALQATALSMCDMPANHKYEVNDLLQRLKLNTEEDVELYEIIRSGIEPKLEEDALKYACLNMRAVLTNYFNELKIEQIIGRASYMIRFKREEIPNMRKFVAGICTELEPYQVEIGKRDPAIVDEIDFGDISQVSKVFDVVQDQQDGTSILKTGWQGINRMLDGGFRRGDQVVVGALQHKYKTGFTLSIFKHLALYNTPVMIDPAKKPLLLRISFEDDLALNFQFLYSSLKENETGKKADIKGISTGEMARYVMEKLSVNGYNIKMMRVDPTGWTYKDLCNKILELEAQGYEIHVCMVDYLKMMPTTGCTQGPMGSDIRDMFRRMRNFTNPRKICFITPHQLSTEAKQLIRDGRQDFVKEIAGKGYYDGCRTLDNEVDLEMYIHIEKVNGKSYLTVQRGKHRKIEQTPEEHLFCVLPFEKIGGIRDDINGPDTTRKKVGGGPIGSGEETPFWDVID